MWSATGEAANPDRITVTRSVISSLYLSGSAPLHGLSSGWLLPYQPVSLWLLGIVTVSKPPLTTPYFARGSKHPDDGVNQQFPDNGPQEAVPSDDIGYMGAKPIVKPHELSAHHALQ